MKSSEQWIWLPEQAYPDHQTTIYSGFLDKRGGNYTVAEFKREYAFSQEVVSARLRFSGDTLFQLFCNGKCVAAGPVCVGGDFMGNDLPREDFYAFETRIEPRTKTLSFFACVQMMPLQLCDYSKGHGGFMLSGELTLADGTTQSIRTDGHWLVRKNSAYTSPESYDGTVELDGFMPAQVIENIWHTETAPIPVRTETELFPDHCVLELLPGEEKEASLELNKIYAGFLRVQAQTAGHLEAEILCREIEDVTVSNRFVFTKDTQYRRFSLCSAENLQVKVKNCAQTPAKLTVSFIATHYPVQECAETVTNDADLNQVLEVCRHTLKYCRQTHHLDSPKHCEPLACTGDYYIEALMTLFSFGDMGLAEFDLLRTARMLERNDGRIFHTTYSLIWVRMLYDVYMAAGNRELLRTCLPALGKLLKRFEGYIGENGLIETPPDYMFVDWIYIDGISMHHPPKALGQTCLNMFYFTALDTAEKIYLECGQPEAAEWCSGKKEQLRAAVNTQLFDPEKGSYFEGLNTPTDESLLGQWMPANVEKRYYLKHSNILAAYVGICDDRLACSLIEKVISGEIAGDVQPYFLHYLLEAIERCKLADRYTLTVLEKWKVPVKACPKGLVEGFYPPEPTYSFDHSHAWGGTPLYSLPKALMGLKILEPGMKKIRLSPSLLGLQYAKAELLTPFGKVICRLNGNEKPVITHPKEVEVLLAQSTAP